MAEDIAIEPTDFDAVVVSSGLPEVLLASALATSGRSVLLLEPADCYGSDWASVSGDVLTAAAAAAAGAAAGSSGAGTSPEAPGSSSHLQQLLAGCRQYKHPDYAGMTKQYIVDLSPKVLYKGETLVDALVGARAAHYLELKLLQGSYILREGQLLRVPARRADVFTSRALGPADKGRLMKFLSAALEAAGGVGRLQGQFDGRPLVQLLQQEGLSPFLQQIVLYGIAMANTPQHIGDAGSEPPATSAEAGGDVSQSSSGSGSVNQQLLTAAEGAAALQLYAESLERYNTGQTSSQSAFMVPCYGCGSLPEAFVRVAAVAGAVTVLRCGPTAVQARSTSSSTSSEGGATSALSSADAPAAPAESAAPVAPATEAPDSSDGTHLLQQEQQQQQQQPQETKQRQRRFEVVAGRGQVLTTDLVIGQQQLLQQLWRGPSGADPSHSAGNPACSSGNESSNGIPSIGSSSGSSSGGGPWVACCVAVLDRSLVQDESLLMVVVPPGALGPQQQQQYVVRGVQYSPIAGVSPPGKFLLYLSAVLGDDRTLGHAAAGQPPSAAAATAADAGRAGGTGASSAAAAAAAAEVQAGVGSSSLGQIAEEVLLPVVSALADITGVEGVPAVRSSGATSSSGSQGAADSTCGTSSSTQQQQEEAAGPARSRARVLQLVFSMQRQGGGSNTGPSGAAASAIGSGEDSRGIPSAHTDSSSSLPAGLVPCPSADPTLVGYGRLVEDTQQLLQQHCPGVPWLGDGPVAAGDAPGGAGASGAAAAVAEVLDEEEEEAIDELTAALAELEKGL